ncbi:MAG TPA: hypothetical protein DIT13_14985 [Verrucomicrobiales bacterium]|nr:hypothetical protein [Verrucomicrobiales bacterium]HRJ08739.1 hypothetical protein [Prosthecobacter sp.]HRK12930.1 hypothetical protein [Prosthecobacter sp.]
MKCLTLCLLTALFCARAVAQDYFRHDSRALTQASKAVLITDLSRMQPQAALITGRRQKGKWKMLPFETAEMKGTALSVYSATNPPRVSLPLLEKGWHSVHVGLATTSGGFNIGGNGIKAKLSDEPVFRRLANNLALLPNRRAVIQECFVSVAELNGQSLEIAPMPGLPATVCYVKLVPMTLEEVAASRERSKHRTSIATFDGHSWIWPFKPTTAEELAEEFRGYEDTDIGKWWFQVTGGDLVCYPSKVGTYPGEGTVDFPTGAYAAYTKSLETLFKAGVNPLKVARDAAKAQGAEFHVMLRPGGWAGSMPYEETFNSRFYYEHPEWRCLDRDGTPTFYMSYAVPEVRRHLIELLRETLELQPEGVGFLFNRGMPLMLWEEAFCVRFKEMHNADARSVEDDDPRIQSTRAAVMTGFMREVRALLDETAARQGRKERYKISLGTFAREADNQRWGLDLPNWIQLGLVDDIAVTWFAYHTSFEKTPGQIDMDYYRRITQGTSARAWPMVIAWKTGKPKELCQKTAAWLADGAPGIAIWDPQVMKGWPEGSPGNVFDVLGRLGHKDDLLRWSKNGVPSPLSVPLTRLDDNHFSRWFPNTGF